jgi:hypothetical protein
MNQSESINELAAALSKAQGEMQAAIKDKVNPFYKSKYADLGSVWDAARPALSKHGLCIMQTMEMANDKNQIILVTTLAHTSGQWVKSYLPLNPDKADSQGIGKAITYLRRYSLSSIVGVVCDDDDDGEASVGRGKTHAVEPKKEKEAVAEVEYLSTNEVNILSELLTKLDQDSYKSFQASIKQNFNADSLHDIPKSAYQKCLVSLNAKIKLINDNKKEG